MYDLRFIRSWCFKNDTIWFFDFFVSRRLIDTFFTYATWYAILFYDFYETKISYHLNCTFFIYVTCYIIILYRSFEFIISSHINCTYLIFLTKQHILLYCQFRLILTKSSADKLCYVRDICCNWVFLQLYILLQWWKISSIRNVVNRDHYKYLFNEHHTSLSAFDQYRKTTIALNWRSRFFCLHFWNSTCDIISFINMTRLWNQTNDMKFTIFTLLNYLQKKAYSKSLFLFFESRFKTWHNTSHFQFQQTSILIEVASRRSIHIRIELTMIKLNSSNCDNVNLFFLNKSVSCFEFVVKTIVEAEELIVCHWKSNVNSLIRTTRSRFIYIFEFKRRQRLRWSIQNQFVKDRYRVLETIY